MNEIAVQPIERASGTFRPPGSKSLTNRALIAAALAHGTSTLQHPLESDDTRFMRQALQTLGVQIDDSKANEWEITGSDGAFPASQAELFLGNAGTAMRFLTAVLAACPGRYTLDGVPRMQQRPIAQLVDALRHQGASIDYLQNEGCPPVVINNSSLKGGSCSITDPQSSQYVSAMLLAAPLATRETSIEVAGNLVSAPYVRMTLAVMRAFGIDGLVEGNVFTISPASYRATSYAIEPDASSASYLLAAAAITGGKVTVEGLGINSCQGDVGFADLLHQMGAGLVFGNDFITVHGLGQLRGIDVDLAAMPDMAQTLAVVALFANGPTTIRNVANLRIKETDRIAALESELTKLGAQVQVLNDGLRINPPAQLKAASIATYDDHRMAMSFALAALKCPGIKIQNPECVSKTFPGFFQTIESLRSE